MKKFSLGNLLFGYNKNNLYKILKMFAFVAIVVFAFVQNTEAGTTMLMTAPVLGLTANEQEFMEKVKGEVSGQYKAFTQEVDKLIQEAVNKNMTGKEISEKLKSIEEQYTKIKDFNFAELQKSIKEVVDRQAEIGEAMKKLKNGGMENSPVNQFKQDLNDWANSDEFKVWASGNLKSKGNSPSLELKYSLTSGRTGSVLTTTQMQVVSDSFQPRRMHIRNLMTVTPTDMPNLTFDQISSWVAGIDMVSENGNAPTFDITTTEKTVNVKRIAGIMDISNNSLKSTTWVVNHILNRAPEKLLVAEDFQLIFGDGAGNNVDGIYKNATEFTLTGPTFAAGAIASVASYNSGTEALVTFAANHGLSSAYKLTIANSTAYNGTYDVIVASQTKIVINKTYTAEADTSAWTGTSAYYLKNAIDGAQEWDCLVAAASFMACGEYSLSGWILNPATAAKIELLKATDLQYVGKITRVNGVLLIGGVPVLEHNSMPAGRFLGGDFLMAAELLEYEGVSLQFVADVDYVKANKQALYISEQVLLPIINPFMFVKGTFSTVAAALETA